VEVSLSCECGAKHPVDEGMAGVSLACVCGRTLVVPSLSRLRELAGLPRYEANPALVLEEMAAAGQLPPMNVCVSCGTQTDEVIDAVAECEKAWRREIHRPGWLLVLLGWWGFLLRWNQEEREFGKTVTTPVPIRLCRTCRGGEWSQAWGKVLRVSAWAVLVAGVVFTVVWSPWALLLLGGTAALFALAYVQERWRQRAMKQVLAAVPLYARLFEKYPDARVVT
jgi:hypothetical protein